MIILNDEGNEVEVYTAEEVQAQLASKEEEFGKTLTQREQELSDAKAALGARAGEFSQFRKLNEETVAKLTVAERTIYENQVALQEERDRFATAEKARVEAQVDSAIRAKAGTDEKLFGKMKDMWNVIGIEANTPEAIENKTKMIIGAISTTEPDLIATISGFSGGSWQPTGQIEVKKESFADTDAGKALANELGLKL